MGPHAGAGAGREPSTRCSADRPEPGYDSWTHLPPGCLTHTHTDRCSNHKPECAIALTSFRGAAPLIRLKRIDPTMLPPCLLGSPHRCSTEDVLTLCWYSSLFRPTVAPLCLCHPGLPGMCGFRPLAELRGFLASYPELRAVVGEAGRVSLGRNRPSHVCMGGRGHAACSSELIMAS